MNAALKAERIDFYYGIAEGNYLIGDLVGAERGIEQMLGIKPNFCAHRSAANLFHIQGRPVAPSLLLTICLAYSQAVRNE